jgi:hypothetical protein
MKKVASLIAAGAMLLSTYSVAFASWPWGTSVKQTGFTVSTTKSVAATGENKQFGGSKSVQMMQTGAAQSCAESVTAGNVNVGGGNVTQFAGTGSKTVSVAKTGGNTQVGGGFFGHSFQSMGTGTALSQAGSITVSNVNVDLD